MSEPMPSLPEWESLPDFGLYMDQMLTFAERCGFGELTAGMINSYVKAGIIDRPEGKKYSRASLAQLLMVAHLKQALPLDALRRLLHPEDGEDAPSLYARFLAGRRRMSESLPAREASTALDFALEAAGCQQLCLRLLGGGEEKSGK